MVEGDYIGTDLAGTKAVGNGETGVLIEGTAVGNTIGGTTAGACNVITSNEDDGVEIEDRVPRGPWLRAITSA